MAVPSAPEACRFKAVRGNEPELRGHLRSSKARTSSADKDGLVRVNEYTPFGRMIEAVEEAMRPTTGSNRSRSRSFSTSANDEELHYTRDYNNL